jgi:glycosyltransferase involved in cell wall biosynthesis
MRILMIAPQPFYEDRGTPIATRRVVESLVSMGHRVDLLTFPAGENLDIPGLTVTRVAEWLPIRSIPIGFSLRKAFLNLFLIPATISKLRRNRYDCIHAIEEAVFPAALISRKFGVPLLYDMQSALPEQLAAHPFFGLRPIQWLLEIAEHWAIRRADRIACSAGLESRIRKVSDTVPVSEWHYPCDEFHPVVDRDNSSLCSLELPEKRFVILYSGNFESYQGLDVLIEAIPIVRATIPHAVFVFVGASPEDPFAERIRLASDAVRVVERQPRSRLPAFFDLADILISPRDSIANLPLKVLEYMATGKPVIATDCPAHRSVLNDDSAMLVAQRPEAISEAIIRLHANPRNARAIGLRAQAYAIERLGWNRFVEDVSQMYELVAIDGYERHCQTV